MIREIVDSDIDQIRKTWVDVFGSSDELHYLYKCYPHVFGFLNERAIVSDSGERSSQIISFLFLLPLDFVTSSSRHKCWLVYKCATLERFRRRGIMSQMLQSAELKMSDYGVDGIVVIPPTDLVWDLFKRNGYSLFSRKRRIVSEASERDDNLHLSRITSRQLHIFRRRVSKNYLEWDKSYSSLFVFQQEGRGIELYSFTYFNIVGEIVCYKQNDLLVVEEIITRVNHSGRLSFFDIQDITNALCTCFGVRYVSFFLPENSMSIGNLQNASLVKSDKLGYSVDNYIY